MTNSGDGESDSLVMTREQVKESSWMPSSAAQLAWEDMKLDWDVCIENTPESKKVGKIKAILNYIGRSKSIPNKDDD